MAKLSKRQMGQLETLLTTIRASLTAGMSIEIVLTEHTCTVELLDDVGATLLATDVDGPPAEQIQQVLEVVEEGSVYVS